jgi:hypothetical protein
MDVDHAAQQGGKTGGGKPGEGFVHNLDGTDLFLREFVGPLEVIDLNLAGVRGGSKIPGFRVSGVNRGEKLVYFVLGQNFGHTIFQANLRGFRAASGFFYDSWKG